MATVPKITPTMEAEHAIRDLAQEFVTHHNKRDIDKLVMLYTNDGNVMAPFQPVAAGTPALRQYFQQAFSEYDQRDLKVETTRVEISNDFAFAFGTFTTNLKMPNGKRMDDHGKWMTTLRLMGTNWRIVGHCFNTDLPITRFTG